MNALEKLKLCFVLTTQRWAQKWVELADEWLDDRLERCQSDRSIKLAGFFKLRSDPDE